MDTRLIGAAAMYARLNGAAHAGDTNGLYDCIPDDADVLRRIDTAEFVDTPLHIAAARGHADFAKAIMYLKPSLAWKLNQDFFSPMHLALQNDHKETVLRLLAVDKSLVRVKGKEGYTLLHHVVRRGNLDLLAQFLKDSPTCIEDVTIRDETALHIAAQNNRLAALEILVQWIWRTHLYDKISSKHLLNLKDRDGNTVLHIAATNSQPQMIKLLLEYNVDTKETNISGLTALNILKNRTRSDNGDESLKILHDFDHSGLRRLKAFLIRRSAAKLLPERLRYIMIEIRDGISNMSAERINALLVVFTLILTTTYQAMNNPPGGVWQGDLSANLTAHYMATVGRSVMDQYSFIIFFGVNLVVFSLTFLLTVGLLHIATKSWIFTLVIAMLMVCLISPLYVAGYILYPFHLPSSEIITYLSWALRFVPITTTTFSVGYILPWVFFMVCGMWVYRRM